MSNVWLHRYSVLLAVCTLFLVVAGGLVTSNEAGLSVPDWPLSYGRIMPEMVGGVFYEHGHRMVATAIGMMTIGLVIFLHIVEKRRWMKGLGWLALGTVIAQGVLGGLTVLLMLPKGVSMAHACLAELFFSTTVAVALFTSPAWQKGPDPVQDGGWPSMRAMAFSAPVLVLIQVALGAGFRHRAIGIFPHLLGAFVIGGALVMTAIFALTQFPNHKALRPAGLALLGITFVQVMLGVAAFMTRLQPADTANAKAAMIGFTVAHVATGALTMASAITLAILVGRNVRPKSAAIEQAQYDSLSAPSSKLATR
ncbi:MAG: COX15/CtaA family protein [Bryobacteraceae bacterium]